MKSLFNEKLNKFNELYDPQSKKSGITAKLTNTDKIIFVLPLSGRYETFLRFLNNFEDVSKTSYNCQKETILFIMDCTFLF